MAGLVKKRFEVPDETRAFVPPGHDAWIVGDEPCVLLDVTGMSNYATGA